MASPTIVKPVADPLDDIDRVAPVDHLMARQDRADLPGNRSFRPPGPDELVDPDGIGTDDAGTIAVDEATAGDVDPDTLGGDEIDPDIALTVDSLGATSSGRGPDDDDPIEEVERLGDDSPGGPG